MIEFFVGFIESAVGKWPMANVENGWVQGMLSLVAHNFGRKSLEGCTVACDKTEG